MNVDIFKNDLMISHLQYVLRSSMTPRRIVHTKGRPWDGFCYILSGRCLYTFSDGTRFTATRGCVLYLAKDALYDMQIEEGPYASIYCDFLFASDAPRQSALVSPKDTDALGDRFSRLLQRFSLQTAGCRSDCLSLLYRIYGALQAGTAPQYLPRSSRHRLETARNRILSHFAEESLSVQSLARDAGISEVHFRKQFQALYGCSPMAYIVRTRIANAKELMRSSDLSLEEIALQSGFSSLSYFCRVFKKETETTPGAYRAEVTGAVSS